MSAEWKQSARKAAKQLGLPVAAGAVAAGIGIVLSRRPDPRRAVPDLKSGAGDLVSDLRAKVEAVVGRSDGHDTAAEGPRPDSQDGETSKRNDLAERRRAREQRRKQRRSQS